MNAKHFFSFEDVHPTIQTYLAIGALFSIADRVIDHLEEDERAGIFYKIRNWMAHGSFHVLSEGGVLICTSLRKRRKRGKRRSWPQSVIAINLRELFNLYAIGKSIIAESDECQYATTWLEFPPPDGVDDTGLWLILAECADEFQFWIDKFERTGLNSYRDGLSRFRSNNE